MESSSSNWWLMVRSHIQVSQTLHLDPGTHHIFYLFIHPTFHPSIHLFFLLSNHPSPSILPHPSFPIHPSFHPSIHPSPSILPSIHSSIQPSFHPSFHPSIHPSSVAYILRWLVDVNCVLASCATLLLVEHRIIDDPLVWRAKEPTSIPTASVMMTSPFFLGGWIG